MPNEARHITVKSAICDFVLDCRGFNLADQVMGNQIGGMAERYVDQTPPDFAVFSTQRTAQPPLSGAQRCRHRVVVVNAMRPRRDYPYSWTEMRGCRLDRMQAVQQAL